MDNETSEAVVDDLSIMLCSGRTRTPADALQQSIDAERLGFRGVFVAERYDMKEVGAMLGGVGALTRNIKLGTAALSVGSRHPLVTAALTATLQAMYGSRVILGLGRSDTAYFVDQGMKEVSFQGLVDYANIIRRLWAGESVAYEGELGSFGELRMADPPEGAKPEIWSIMMGGPKACRTAARFADGVMFTPFLTPDAVANSVRWIREERERLGMDPHSIRICHPIVTAPALSDERTIAQTGARLVNYIVSGDKMQRILSQLNGWSDSIMTEMRNHPLFTRVREGVTVDRTFTHADLLEPANLVPEKWLRETAAFGSVDECIKVLETFKATGVDELNFYGTTPKENEKLIEAWRTK